ncbi:MFS transporter [Flavobacterium sp. M31R6]|jgi:MFS family permease|uniref:MFS transporter n=1 Tax=Flavobacterium sp. M31R6 TaxID=2739062 RepID=UPI001569BDE2|nr:MFS transporter [Flavobacterium sp. M31R6]QKJ64172.1 MFS transporter [Flavobacterium sp. M31R6]
MSQEKIKLGLKENWKQFWLLVFINALVGGMIGLERTLLPEIAEKEFHLSSTSIILSFIILFGLFKAITNYFAGTLANKFGRKKLLLYGWIIGIPVPFILIYANNWNWILFANILLGINQGLTWSSTVVMKMDLVGEKQRGFAMGLNEFAGYGTLGLVAYATSVIADNYGVRPYPFYIGIVIVILGTLLTWFFVKDTTGHVKKETEINNTIPLLKNTFTETSWLNKNLGSVTQAGLINNLNDAMIWGIIPILLAQRGFGIANIGIITATYPIVWGLGQLITGKLSDIYCKRDLLFWGMLLQGLAIVCLVFSTSIFHFVTISVLLGIGTAIVYPTFLSSIAENTNPEQRAKSIGVFRFWRDFGYVIGAILTGVLTNIFNIEFSIGFIGVLTIISATIIIYRMSCKITSKRLLKKYF